MMVGREIVSANNSVIIHFFDCVNYFTALCVLCEDIGFIR